MVSYVTQEHLGRKNVLFRVGNDKALSSKDAEKRNDFKQRNAEL